MRRPVILGIVILFVTSCFNPATQVHTQDGQPLRILLPLYSFPTDDDGQYWYSVAKAGNELPITVIWGMSDTADAAVYQKWIPVLRYGKYIELLAYVATTGGTRDPDSVKYWVSYYARNFDIDGIFFDEVNHDDDKIAYYKDLVAYARSFDNVQKIILNSSYAPEYFCDTTGADAVVIFEDTRTAWSKFDLAAYQSSVPSKKAVIVSNVLLKSGMKAVIEQAVAGGVGYVYVTNRGYDKLPSYWNEEVDVVKSINVLQ